MVCQYIVVIVKSIILLIGKKYENIFRLISFFFYYRYCDNCADWLCIQCKNAHARVRLTKDHIVTQKTGEEARKLRGIVHNEKLTCQVCY